MQGVVLSPWTLRRCGPDGHSFAGSSEDAEDLRGFVAGAAEPVRHLVSNEATSPGPSTQSSRADELRRRHRRRHGHSPCARRPERVLALLAGGQRISARRLLVTTGLRDELPDIPGSATVGPLVEGISSYRDLKGFPPYLGDAVKDTTEVGPMESPDLEAIAALKPDLIVSATVRHDLHVPEWREAALDVDWNSSRAVIPETER